MTRRSGILVTASHCYGDKITAADNLRLCAVRAGAELGAFDNVFGPFAVVGVVEKITASIMSLSILMAVSLSVMRAHDVSYGGAATRRPAPAITANNVGCSRPFQNVPKALALSFSFSKVVILFPSVCIARHLWRVTSHCRFQQQ